MPKISQSILKVLDQAQTDGPRLVLVGQLDRKTYTAANDVLTAAGGKWDCKAKAHVFDGDAADAIEPILLTGEYARTKQDFGQFDSPEDVVAEVIERADIYGGMIVLEPSAGLGRIAWAAVEEGGVVDCVEIDPQRVEHLYGGIHDVKGYRQVCGNDFLTLEPNAIYDRVVMNPPFAKQADIDHVLHAAKFLKPGGRLVAVMSASVMFRENSKTTAFREFVSSRGGSIERLPDNAFKASGTLVNTCIVSFKGAA